MDLEYLFTGTYTGTSWNVTFCHDYSPLIHFQILFHFSVFWYLEIENYVYQSTP